MASVKASSITWKHFEGSSIALQRCFCFESK